MALTVFMKYGNKCEFEFEIEYTYASEECNIEQRCIAIDKLKGK